MKNVAIRDLFGFAIFLSAHHNAVREREPEAWRAGHIDEALHVPMRQLPARIVELPSDRQVLVVCRVGARSASATAFLVSLGRNAVNLSGGMNAWAAAGRSMVAEGDAAPRVA